MTVIATQSFLPLVTKDRRVLGITAITTTDFTGEEKFFPPGVLRAFVLSGSVGAMTLAALKALTGVLTVTVNGEAITTATINLSAVTSFANAASVIQTAFNTAAAGNKANAPNVTFANLRFKVESPLLGPASTISAVTGTLSAGLFLSAGAGAVVNPWSAPPNDAIPIALFQPRVPVILDPQVQRPIKYMGATVTQTQERTGIVGPAWLQPFIPATRWNMAPGFSRYDWKGNALTQMLEGSLVDVISAPVAATPTAVNGSLEITWTVGFGESNQMSFFEANWVSLFQAKSGNTNAVSISVGAPTLDPSGGHLKVFVVQSYPAIVNQSVLYNTLRFVKTVAESIPSGTYTWPATISNSDGSTVAVTLTVTSVG